MTEILHQARRGHPGLFWFAAGMAALAGVLIALSLVDQRTVLGAEVWLKPLKFAISFVAYAGALAWMLGQLHDRTLRRTGWVLVAASVVEMIIITGQAARGRRSHFNVETAADLILFEIMGATIAVLFVCTVIVAAAFLRQRSGDPALGLAIRLGVLLSLLGMLVGVIMVVADGHAVGVPDGGPGLPLVGWSTTGGDLRAGHFLGLHGLQALPVLAAVLIALAGRGGAATRLDDRARTQLVAVAAAGYAAMVVSVTIQALRAQPLLAPDPSTLAGWAAITGGVAAAAGLVLRTAAGRGADAGRPVVGAGTTW